MPVLPPNAIQGADADAAQVANVLDPVALAESQVLPPPPLASVPMPTDQLMTLASAPPPAVPLTPVDAALAPALPPDGGPALSVLPPPVVDPAAAPAGPAAAAEKNLATAEEIGAEGVKIAEDKAADDVKIAEAKAEHAKQTETAVRALQARQETHRLEAEARVTEARARAESEPYHTFWESRSIGQNVLTGIGLILGGVSWNPNHVNRGVQILQHAMEQDFAMQKEKHADLWRAVEAAEKGEAQLDQRQLREVARFSAVNGAKWDAVAGRLSAMVAANKGKGDVNTAKKQALEASERATTFYRQAASAEAAASHMREMDAEAKRRDEEMARHHAEQENTAAIRAAKYKTRGGGSGGGGGKIEQAAIVLQDKIAEAKAAGKPMGMADIDRLAATGIDVPGVGKVKIPLVGKPNTINARQIAADAAKEAAAEKKDLTLSDKEENTVIRDSVTKAPIGRVESARAARKFHSDDIALEEAAHRMKDLLDDIKKNGTKLTDPAKVAERVTKYANAVIAIGVVSPLGKTNESLHLEGRSIGLPGAFDPTHMKESLTSLLATTGANLDAVDRKFKEITHKKQALRNTLIPLSDDDVKKYSKNIGGGSPEKPDLILKGGGTARWNKERGGYERVADIVL